MTRLLLLVPTTSYRVGDFLEAAAGLDVEVIVGSNQQPVLAGLGARTAFEVDFRNPDAALEQIAALAAERPLDAIVASDEETTWIAAEAAARLGLGHNPAPAVEAAGNKYLFRQALVGSDVRSPKFRLFSLDDDPAQARDLPFPCVLKPLAFSASRGVIRADGHNSFVAAFHRIAALLHQHDPQGGRSTVRSILVEDYVPGIEVALEGLLVAGELTVLALFDKPDPLEGPFFAETIYTTPSRQPTEVQARIREITARAVAALGLCSGPIHAELRINDDGIWPIEIAARSIGGLCSRMLRFGTGLSLEEIILRQALGQPLESLKRQDGGGGVMMLPVPESGRLLAVEGQEAARKVPGITDLTITIPLGESVQALPEGDRYLGFLFAEGATPEGVEATLRQAFAKLEVRIEPT